MITRTRETRGLSPDSLGAVRIKRNIWRESSLGVIATAGDPLGRTHSWLIGPDLTFQTSRFRGNKNFRAGAWALVMGRESSRGDQSAAGFRVDYPNDLWSLALTSMRVGDGFDPSVGFVPRSGIYNHKVQITNTQKRNGWLRSMEHEFQGQVVTDLGGRWESYRFMIIPLNWRFASGDRVEFNYVPTGERLLAPFAVARNVRIPPGAYDWTRWRLEVGTATKRTISNQLTWWFGDFYDGTLSQIIWTGTWHPSTLVTVEFNGERDQGTLREGAFVQAVSGTRVRFDVSPDMQVSGYWQYDTQSRSIGSNSKLRWTFRGLGDLFVIYNHNVRDLGDRWGLDSNQLLVKLQYAFRY